MGVRIVIPAYLQPFAADQKSVSAKGKTVGECLQDLTKQFPDMEKALFAKKDRLHTDVRIYVNSKDAETEGLAKPLADGDELSIIYVIGGG